jgi:hypothetical protein
MKQKLCKAFCDDLSVSKVPAGLAVTTAFSGADGDHISFFVIKTNETKYRIEDDGVTLPYLEGSGLDFKFGGRSSTRSRVKVRRVLVARSRFYVDDRISRRDNFPRRCRKAASRSC